MHSNGCPEALSVLFGPQGAVTQESLVGIRNSLQENSDLKFLSGIVSDLHALWPIITNAWPDLSRLEGKAQLIALSNFLQGGSVLSVSEASNNIIQSPLTVVSQVIDFWKLTHGLDHRQFTETQFQDVQGFCLGFLGATVVSCSKNEVQFQSLAATAVRLALCMGALVDLDALDAFDCDNHASAVAVRWKSTTDLEHLKCTLKLFPAAYISCISDPRTATITLPKSDLSSFMAILAQEGVVSKSLAPRGRWHNQANLQGVQAIIGLCEQDERFRLPNATALNSSLLSNMTGKPILKGSLHSIALHSILTDQSRWDLMFHTSSNAMKLRNMEFRHITIGEKVMVPRAANGNLNASLPDELLSFHQSSGSKDESPSLPCESPLSSSVPTELSLEDADLIPESAIAVIGMACRYPDADSVDEFWNVISDGKCVIRPMPQDRFDPSELVREPKGPFWGGYVRGIDMFDHRFFGISGREAKSMDPQQRLCLQVTYEALESAGYYGLCNDGFDNEVGCYVGSANDDYFDNVSSHPVNAFSLTGTLRSFISGRVSHCLGITGPSMVLDTACSAAAVAIHTACQALQNKDCSTAVAGGTCSMSSSKMTQNLIGAGFLSPTGPSKAFDRDADGYCRAEGAGIVVLKPLRDAVRDGNFVLGVITGSAVNQGANTSSITVPDGPSQYSLYNKALKKSDTAPTSVTYVESHGTGTQVGDPIEFKSIRDVFGGVHRRDDVYVGSVKDNIGHTEASSGVASLIKTLLMIHHKTIPRQANFRHLNPKIEPLGSDHVLIPTESQPWNSSKRRALINNYGAGGNNAAMVVEEWTTSVPNVRNELSHFPVYVSGKTPDAVRAYCDVLAESLQGKDLRDVAYNLAVKQNRKFENSLVLTSQSIEELSIQLKQAARGLPEVQKRSLNEPSIVLCFGGQDGKIAHISRALYDGSILLQHHLAECEAVLSDVLSLPSLFPAIFDPAPINDIVTLHCTLFAIQYACAKSWMDSGVRVNRIIGHSFGQLTALCISGSLSLADTLRLVMERAKIVQTNCGPENGIMLAVTAERSDIDRLLLLAQQQSQSFTADIACYNGPRGFVIAGDEASIQAVEKVSEGFVQCKRLENSHAFHSQLLDPIVPEFLQAAEQYHYGVPAIPIEACSDDDDWFDITAEKIVRHTRMPVHFMNAVRKVEQKVDGPIIWLEAGSGSPIVPIIKRAVNSSDRHTYIATTLRNADASAILAKATCSLWSNNVKAQFWPFHRSQHSSYNWVNLPPYQFAKTSHWLEYKPRAWAVETAATSTPPVHRSLELVSLLPNQSLHANEVLFEINPNHELYQLNTKGHEVVDQTLVPASLYNEFVLTASDMLSNEETGYIPHISKLSMSSPLVVSPVGSVLLKLTKDGMHLGSWDFMLFTKDNDGKSLIHATGHITVSNPPVPVSISHFQAVQSLMFDRCQALEHSPMSIGFKGPTAYQAMRRVVTYLDYYHGIQSIYSLGNEATARITLPPVRPKGMGAGFCDPVLVDSFTQVSGILANCFSLPEDGDMWVCNYISDVIFTQQFIEDARKENKSWVAYSKYSLPAPKRLTCNIFVFDPDTQDIVLTILSIEFQKVSIKSLKKVLGRLNSVTSPTEGSIKPHIPAQASLGRAEKTLQTPVPTPPVALHQSLQSEGNAAKGFLRLQQIREMLRDVLDIPLDEVTPDTVLEDLGVDSLLATELYTEISKRFGVSISPSELANVINVRGLAEAVSMPDTIAYTDSMSSSIPTPQSSPPPAVMPPQSVQKGSQNLDSVREMLSSVLEVPIDEILAGSSLEDLGVDSLLATELFSEMNKRFGVLISHSDFALITDVQGLAGLVFGSSPVVPMTSAVQSTAVRNAKPTCPASQDNVQTVIFAERDGTPLSADIYFPEGPIDSQKVLPVALMIHGGGHVISTRRDIRHDQTQILLRAGFLPVSVDYRLCPEITIHEGAMQDIRDAFYWARKVLPTVPLRRPDIRADGDRIVAVGWSSGGHLAMSLGWTAPSLGIKPPEAILGFYCPSDYEDPFWSSPNLPFGQKPVPPPGPGYDFLYDGLHDKPTIGYTPTKRALGGWMSLEDPRSRIILHMNWEGKSLPVLINGLRRTGAKTVSNPPMPSVEQIRAISPLAQIHSGNYKTPTFLIHGTRDDLVPWQASQRIHDALRERGVTSELVILEDALHLFDLYPASKKDFISVKAVNDGYDFLCRHV
ncbi:hypothetical protein BDV25DRAFT_141606 [Aspergillus avenaceus]|uniref:Non-reducing polyketide synthase aveA n=1 Tax=Aspergillus avenaceus TaxID=36643 RepID=AVEA_ASPAV|nr:hypothetical protein BDV25DRAFT_141606 [Aspergillus avenaceus]